jgi:hypothetical protein
VCDAAREPEEVGEGEEAVEEGGGAMPGFPPADNYFADTGGAKGEWENAGFN